jgi:hypothetical protein
VATAKLQDGEVNMTPSGRATPFRLLAIAWALVGLGALVLFVAYPTLPSEVILYRSPWGTAKGPKSWLTVGRIALMGAGQLGAATAIVVDARSSTFWRPFWCCLALVAGVKTLLECLSMTATPGTTVEHALFISTLLLIGLFVLSAARWWRRGPRDPHPPLTPAGQLALYASLGIWALFALAPRLIR